MDRHSEWSELCRLFVVTFQLRFMTHHYLSRSKSRYTEIEWSTSTAYLCWWCWFIGCKYKFHKERFEFRV